MSESYSAIELPELAKEKTQLFLRSPEGRMFLASLNANRPEIPQGKIEADYVFHAGVQKGYQKALDTIDLILT
jgi:hypothetical protein